MPNVMIALLNIGGALCSMPQKFGSCPLLDCRAVMLPWGEWKTWEDAKWILHMAKFRYIAQPPKMYI